MKPIDAAVLRALKILLDPATAGTDEAWRVGREALVMLEPAPAKDADPEDAWRMKGSDEVKRAARLGFNVKIGRHKTIFFIDENNAPIDNAFWTQREFVSYMNGYERAAKGVVPLDSEVAEAVAEILENIRLSKEWGGGECETVDYCTPEQLDSLIRAATKNTQMTLSVEVSEAISRLKECADLGDTDRAASRGLMIKEPYLLSKDIRTVIGTKNTQGVEARELAKVLFKWLQKNGFPTGIHVHRYTGLEDTCYNAVVEAMRSNNTQAVEIVTMDEFADRMSSSGYVWKGNAERILKEFPNGLKIKIAPEGEKNNAECERLG